MPSVMSVEPPAPLHKTETFQGLDRNDFAYKMVQKMGWAEGEGLGRENKGITKHIWTKKRADQVGIGAEATNDWGAHSVQTNTFNQLLAKLDVIVNNSDSEEEEDAAKKKDKKGGGNKKKAKKTPSKDEASSSEESKAEEGSKKAKKQKKDRKEGSTDDKKRKRKPESDSSDSDSSDDSDLEKNAASTSTEDYVGRKAGRSFAAAAVMKQRYAYKRSFMRNSKDVKSYSSEDLSQILGFSVPPKVEDSDAIKKNAIKQHGRAEASSGNDSADCDSAKSEEPKKKEKKQKKEKKSKRKAEESDAEADDEPAAAAPAPHVPSELNSMILKGLFQYGGLLSGLKEKKEQDWEFNEETQEKIATDAHAAKVEARKGLGFSNDRPSKLGKDYTGKKMTFDEDEEEEQEPAKSPKEETAETKEERKARKKQRKLEKQQQGAAEAEAEEAQEQEEQGGAKKKKKLKKSISSVDDIEPKQKKLKRSSSFP